jgi:hypothetical protein
MMFSSSSVLSIGRGEAPRRSATAREPLKKEGDLSRPPSFLDWQIVTTDPQTPDEASWTPA